MARHRNYVFTNYNLDIDIFDTFKPAYVAYGLEVCPTTGRQHQQGWLHWKDAKTHSAVKKKLKGIHTEPMIASLEQNDVYCGKEGAIVEQGIRPLSNDDKGRAEQLRWKRMLDQAKEGKIEEIDAREQIRYYSTFKAISMDYMQKPEPLENVCGLWIYGIPGTGKSHAVYNQCKSLYIKPISKQWNGYQNEDVAWLDELSPDHSKWIAPFIKLWGDKWPFHADVKYGAKQIRPRRFIVTSNYSIEDMGFSSVDAKAIRRRFTEVEKKKDQNIIIEICMFTRL